MKGSSKTIKNHGITNIPEIWKTLAQWVMKFFFFSFPLSWLCWPRRRRWCSFVVPTPSSREISCSPRPIPSFQRWHKGYFPFDWCGHYPRKDEAWEWRVLSVCFGGSLLALLIADWLLEKLMLMSYEQQMFRKLLKFCMFCWDHCRVISHPRVCLTHFIS